MLKLPIGHYTSREERAEFIAVNYASCLTGTVLDVGCGDAYLGQHVASYVGVDIAGNPDIVIDLEGVTLPFHDRAFDTIVCTDVLEHLDAFHQVFADLFRVATHHVIISLPNMYALGWRLRFLSGRTLSKEYSLEPRNRHKWLPSYQEASSFFRARLPQGWRVAREFGYYPPAWWRRGPLYKWAALAYPNLLATAYWVLCELHDA